MILCEIFYYLVNKEIENDDDDHDDNDDLSL